MSMIPELSVSRKSNYDVIPDGEYEARIVRVVGLGVHNRDPWIDPKTKAVTPKNPAFRMDLAFELIGVDATGTDNEGKPLDPRPACQFKTFDVNPRAKNSGILNLIKMIDPSVQALKGDLGWFKDMLLGQPVNILVNSYVNKAGEKKNSIKSITPIPTKYRDSVGAPRSELIFFEPYAETDANLAAYQAIFPFQRNLLTQANDAKNIPLAGREVTKASDIEQKDATPSIPTINEEPQSTFEEDDSPF
ncbi:hypothetical protein PQC41_gp034 [Escherichia phage vB_EcoP_SU7]|uniref:Uncharacterized protein n=1 Tax=Escherichia phage vB_EcoP_SU7 TaxID=2849626 RepID=A0A8F3C9B3_9CAUD|nr:hypothetical protein PQC41_gp034 [Escherichia phage vB_EcoP_SU7]QWY14151.1 hypothetical protein SU7_34 [Escherichia phage vB_EcoP_SU7]